MGAGRLLLPLVWHCAPAKVGAWRMGRVAAGNGLPAPDGASVVGWRTLHGRIVYLRTRWLVKPEETPH